MKFKFIIEDTEENMETMIWSSDLDALVEEMNGLLKQEGHIVEDYNLVFLSDEESATLSYSY